MTITEEVSNVFSSYTATNEETSPKRDHIFMSSDTLEMYQKEIYDSKTEKEREVFIYKLTKHNSTFLGYKIISVPFMETGQVKMCQTIVI